MPRRSVNRTMTLRAGPPKSPASFRPAGAGALVGEQAPCEVCGVRGRGSALGPPLRHAPDGFGVVRAGHDPVDGSGVLAAIDVRRIVENHLLGDAETSQPT